MTSKTLDDKSFASILTNSLPESYSQVVSMAYTTAMILNQTPTIPQIIAVVESEYSRHQIVNGGIPGSATPVALLSHLHKQQKKPKKKQICTNPKCRFHHNHEFKDCKSIGGPMHSQNPSKAGSQKPNGNCNAKQIMHTNMANETSEEVEMDAGAFNVITSFNITDITADSKIRDPSKHVDMYDSGATCHMSPYIDEFINFSFIEPKPISTADNCTFKAVGKGMMKITIPNRSYNPTSICLKDVHYTPTIAFTLVSLS